MRTILLTLAFSLTLQAQVSIGSLISTPGSSINGDAGTHFFAPGINGAHCDNATDDTTAFNNLISSTVSSGGGRILVVGTCLISSGAITFPNAGLINTPTVEIYGYGNTTSGDWSANIPTGASQLNLTFNASPGKIDARFLGQLIIHDINLIDSGSDCAPFVYLSNASPTFYDVTFSGTGAQLSACNDAIVYGGTSLTIGGGSNAPFQGYAADIHGNFFDKIRRAGWYRAYANSLKFTNNTVSASSGSNLTTAITACTNANPAVCTAAGHGFNVGSTYQIKIIGATGNWTPINGSQTAVIVSSSTFSLTGINSTAFGALAGSPAYYSGAVLDFDGGGVATVFGSLVSDNYIEVEFYARFVNAISSTRLGFINNSLNDGQIPGVTSVQYWFGTGTLPNGAIYNTIVAGHHDDSGSGLIPTANTYVGQTVVDSNASSVSAFNNPLIVAAYQPAVDSGQAIEFFHANGTTIAMDIDTTNQRVGIGTASPAWDLHVATTGSSSTISLTDTGSNSQGVQMSSISKAGYLSTNTAQPWFLRTNSVQRAQVDGSNPILYVGAGTGTSANGVVSVGAIRNSGTQFTISGCSATITSGGATTGTLASGTLGACTVVVTFGGVATNAPTGYNCWSQDVTTPADTWVQTASGTSTATFSGTTASGDALKFGCQQF